MLTPYIQFKFYYFKHKLFFAVESIERYRLVWRVRRKSFLLFCFLCTRTEKKLTFNLEKPFLCKQILFLLRHLFCVCSLKTNPVFLQSNCIIMPTPIVLKFRILGTSQFSRSSRHFWRGLEDPRSDKIYSSGNRGVKKGPGPRGTRDEEFLVPSLANINFCLIYCKITWARAQEAWDKFDKD